MTYKSASEPEELSRLFIERFNGGDAAGVAALYEPHAVLANPPGQLTSGVQNIQRFYEQRLKDRPHFTGEVQRAIRCADLAFTSTHYEVSIADPAGQPTTLRTASAEVARQQPDGSWLWAIDQPNALRSTPPHAVES
jgi:uncharacterized protein (TIGR02246 family)